MRLAKLFSEHSAHAGDSVATSLERLDGALWQMVESGRREWPQIEIAPEEFVRFLAKQLPPEAHGEAELPSLRAGDLYLVCALGVGHPAATLAFENEYMPAVHRALQRIQTPDSLIADIIQGLYGYLLERQNAPQGVLVSRRGYAGRGALKGWLCTCAVHQAGRLHRRKRREVDLDQSPSEVLPDQGKSPELSLLTGEMKSLFESAFREAVAALSSRERNLLRYHFLSALSIDQIGIIYRVHRATAARWVNEARARLATLTRKKFLLAAPIHAKSYAEILALVRSQLAVNLASLLKQVTANELPLDAGAASEE